MVTALREKLLNTATPERSDSVLYQTMSLFASLLYGQEEYVTPTPLIKSIAEMNGQAITVH